MLSQPWRWRHDSVGAAAPRIVDHLAWSRHARQAETKSFPSMHWGTTERHGSSLCCGPSPLTSHKEYPRPALDNKNVLSVSTESNGLKKITLLGRADTSAIAALPSHHRHAVSAAAVPPSHLPPTRARRHCAPEPLAVIAPTRHRSTAASAAAVIAAAATRSRVRR